MNSNYKEATRFIIQANNRAARSLIEFSGKDSLEEPSWNPEQLWALGRLCACAGLHPLRALRAGHGVKW